MVVHDRFVLLQVRKTGGTFLTEVLQRELPQGSAREVAKHLSWSKAPPDAAGRPVLAYTRNPWDWYVSWYHFNRFRGLRNPVYRAVSDEGRRDFAGVVRSSCTYAAEELGADLYTWFFNLVVTSDIPQDTLTIGRYESLIDDFDSFLAGVGVSLPDGAIERMRTMAPRNASARGPYRTYYDEELRDLVGEACGPLIDRFGYEF